MRSVLDQKSHGLKRYLKYVARAGGSHAIWMTTSTPATQILKFTNHELPSSKGPKPLFSQGWFIISFRIISRPNSSPLKNPGCWQDFGVYFRLTLATLNTINPQLTTIGGGDKDQSSIIQNVDVSLFATYGYNREWQNIPCKAFGYAVGESKQTSGCPNKFVKFCNI